MTVPVRDLLERLCRLRDLDVEVIALEKELHAVPAADKDLAAESEAAVQKIKALEDRNRIFKAQIKLRENELKSAEQKIQRVKDQSSQVKTNKEFMAFRAELSNYQADADRLQGEILKILEAVAQADAKIAQHKAEKDAVEARRAEARASADARLGSLRARRDQLKAQRPSLLEGIPPEPKELYDRARRARGNAVVPVEGEYCSGCMERLTRNDQIAVENAARVVTCRACGRILVAPGVRSVS